MSLLQDSAAELPNLSNMEPEYHDLLHRIAARIRQRRRELGMTQEELAGDRYTKSFISQVEKATVWPSLLALAYIARRLRCPIEWLVAENPVYRPPVPPLVGIARELGMKPAQVRAVLEAVLRTARPEVEETQT